MKELFISRGVTVNYAAVIENGLINNLYVENCEEKNITGNVYKGRIENVVKGLNAYFVNIGTNKNAILHFDDAASDKYERGKDIIVQVKREPQEDKGARLTESISIPGKFVIYITDENKLHISKKISDKDQIERFLKLKDKIKDCGGIVRTEAVDFSDDEIINELLKLKAKWDKIKLSSEYLKSPCMLYTSRDFYSYIVREYISSDIGHIYINRENDKKIVQDILDDNHLNNIDISSLNYEIYNLIKKIINYCYKEKYILPSGGFLYVDRTHSLTSIDVNSGKFVSEDKEETAFKTNLEACNEIFNIIKFRNISGIILIDFIDMSSPKYKSKLYNALNMVLKNDKVHNYIYGFTRLQLMEMSRANKNQCIDEIIFSDYENKKYKVSFILKLIEDECCKSNRCYKNNKFEIKLNDKIISCINNDYADFKNQIKDIYNIDLQFIKDEKVIDYEIKDN